MFPHANSREGAACPGTVVACQLLRRQLEMARDHGLPLILCLGSLLKTPEFAVSVSTMSCMPGFAASASHRQLPAQDDAERQGGGEACAKRSIHLQVHG